MSLWYCDGCGNLVHISRGGCCGKLHFYEGIMKQETVDTSPLLQAKEEGKKEFQVVEGEAQPDYAYSRGDGYDKGFDTATEFFKAELDKVLNQNRFAYGVGEDVRRLYKRIFNGE